MTSPPRVPIGARLLFGGVRFLLRLIGSGLLIASGVVHLHLFFSGYRTIPTIGWLFLAQGIVAILLGLAILFTGHRILAALGALFALATLGGYLLSLQFGLFGFREVRTFSGILAGLLEILAFAALAWFALTRRAALPGRSGLAALARGRPGEAAAEAAARGRGPGVGGKLAGIAAAAASVVAFGLLAAALAFAGGNHGGVNNGRGGVQRASGPLRTSMVSGKRVLADSAGQTVYVFAPDKAGKSTCYGQCAAYWPPVRGPVSPGPGISGKLGTTRRTDGSEQETYNGHPLYTYVGDSGPGQAHGNNVNLNGGFWYDVPVSR